MTSTTNRHSAAAHRGTKRNNVREGAIHAAVDRGSLTARGYDRVLRIAWTLADLDGAAYPSREHLDVALFLRQQGQLH